MNESRRAHYTRTASATTTATPWGFTGTFKRLVRGEFKTISKQSAGLWWQQLCLLCSLPWLGCARGCGKPQSIHQNRQQSIVIPKAVKKGEVHQWLFKWALTVIFWKNFYCYYYYGLDATEEKKVFHNQQNPTEDAKSFLSSIHIKQTWGAFTDWTNYPPVDVSHSIQSDKLQSTVMFACRWAALYHTNMFKYVTLAPFDLWTATPRGHMSDFKIPCEDTSVSTHVMCFLYNCQNSANTSV